MIGLAGAVLTMTLLTLLASVTLSLAGQAMQVEVDIFSGSPNPHWYLTFKEADEFLRLFQTLPERNSQIAVSDGLGYNGLIVTGLEDRMDSYRQVSVAKGWVVAEAENQSRQFIDQGRRLEHWLLQTGKGQIVDALYRLGYQAAQFE